MRQQIESAPLLHHLQTYAGEHRGTESKPYDRPDHQYSLERFDHTNSGTTTITSNGLRHLHTDTPFGEEIACTLHTPQAGYARAITGAMCEYVTHRRTGIEYGQIIDNHDELFDGTDKEGLLAAIHPHFDDKFNYITRNPNTARTSDNIQLQIVTLLPITRHEIELAARDIDLLYEHWHNTHPDLLDITRLSTT
ncbi:suppressor of fused domain protein [Kibdelosporangium aridum]|uniref:suppressor of fused domain protein n=1 Tax=Kibdelosporangium aridum TaxID=2030 RepID=UPI00068E61A2